MARPDITLRNLKGSALTYNEMDKNFSSFFYSASVANTSAGNKLRLFYTGSYDLESPGFNPGVCVEVFLPTAAESPTVSVPGSNKDVLFNNNGVLGVDSGQFTYDLSNNFLGLGTNNPQSTLHIKSLQNTLSSTIKLEVNNSTTSNSNTTGFLTLNKSNTDLFRLGKLKTGNDNSISLASTQDLCFGTVTNFSNNPGCQNKILLNSSGVSIGSNIDENTPSNAVLGVQGTLAIGNSYAAGNVNYIGQNTVAATYLPTDSVTNGLLIQSPKSTDGGHVVIGINTDSDNCESFTIAKGCTGTFDGAIATFKADGNVGIGCVDPTSKLVIAGTANITGDTCIEANACITGNATINGTATITGSICGKSCITVDNNGIFKCGLTVSGVTSSFDSNDNTDTLNILRNNSNLSAEALKIGVTDRCAVFDFVEDTSTEAALGCILFKLSGDSSGFTGADAVDVLTLGGSSSSLTGCLVVSEDLKAKNICKTGNLNTNFDTTSCNISNASRHTLLADGNTKLIGSSADSFGDRDHRLLVGECFLNRVLPNSIVGQANVYGYWKLSNGLIIQAGQARVQSGNGLGTGNVSFPVAFPNHALSVVVSSIRAGAGASGANYVFDITNSSFSAVVDAACATFIAIGI